MNFPLFFLFWVLRNLYVEKKMYEEPYKLLWSNSVSGENDEKIFVSPFNLCFFLYEKGQAWTSPP